MSKSEIEFASATTSKQRPGKKLTRSLFRQIVEVEWESLSASDNILGWVNYFWPDCSNYFQGKLSGENLLHLLIKRDGRLCRTIVPPLRNTTSVLVAMDRNDRYFDDLSTESIKKLKSIWLEAEKAEQLFLGDFCYE